MQDHSCLTSIVQNTSGRALYVDFLPTHGAFLADEEQVAFYGDPISVIRAKAPRSQRHLQAFLNALDNGLLTLLQTPSPVLYDETAESTVVLGVDDGDLVIEEPCWLNSLSSP